MNAQAQDFAVGAVEWLHITSHAISRYIERHTQGGFNER